MKGITVPEVIICQLLENIVAYIRKDLNDHKGYDKQTFLYKLLGVDEYGSKIQMNAYNYFLQAKKIFLRKGNLTVNYGYNWDVANIVALHIILPSEQYAMGAIGEDEGYQSEEDAENEIYQEKFTQWLSSNYQVMITSENIGEINVVYHVLMAMLLACVPTLELNGLRIPKFSGQDVMFQDDTIPTGLFHKVINIQFQYELTVPQLIAREALKNIHFNGTPILSGGN